LFLLLEYLAVSLWYVFSHTYHCIIAFVQLSLTSTLSPFCFNDTLRTQNYVYHKKNFWSEKKLEFGRPFFSSVVDFK